MKNKSFSRAVFEGLINGPDGMVVDDQGNRVPPVIDEVTLKYPLDGGGVISATFSSVRTLDVISASGKLVGRVIDYQHVQ